MYVTHALISVHVQMHLPPDTDFIALGHSNSSWNVVSLSVDCPFDDALIARMIILIRRVLISIICFLTTPGSLG